MNYRNTRIGSNEYPNFQRYPEYSNVSSHEDFIFGAGGNTIDRFEDPRPNQTGYIRPSSYVVDTQENKIVGVNFQKNGQFCCSYEGADYDDIKAQIWEDQEQKQKLEQAQATDKKYDEYGVEIKESQANKNEGQSQGQNQENKNDNGITR